MPQSTPDIQKKWGEMLNMAQSDILGTIKGGLGIASKLAGKGLDEVTGMFKDDNDDRLKSGIYWQRGPWSNGLSFSPQIEYYEYHNNPSFKTSLMERITISKAERIFMQASRALVTANQSEMENLLTEVLSKDSQFTDGYFLLGCLYMELGKPASAVTNLQKALLCQQNLGKHIQKYLPSFRMSMPLSPSSVIALYPDLLGVSALLAMSLRLSGNYAGALATMDQLLGVIPTNPLALFITCILRLEAGLNREVFEQLQNILPESTIQCANILLLGKACQNLGDSATAAELFRNTSVRDDLDPVIRLDFSYFLQELAHQGSQISSSCPEYMELYTRLGINLNNSQQIQSTLTGYNSQPVIGQNIVNAIPNEGVNANNNSNIKPQVNLLPTETNQPQNKATQPSLAANQAVNTENSKPTVADISVMEIPPLPLPQPIAQVEPTPKAPLNAPEQTNKVPPQPLPQPIPGKFSIKCLSANISRDLFENMKPLIIGREEGDILLPEDSSVSRSHAAIVFEGGAYWVQDLNSTNGTWVNGHRITTRRLQINRGDKVQFGKTAFIVL